MENTNEKTAGQKLQEELTWKFPSVALEAPERVKEAYDFCEPYKAFLSEAKTERECVLKAEAMLKDAGYTEFDRRLPISLEIRFISTTAAKQLSLLPSVLHL